MSDPEQIENQPPTSPNDAGAKNQKRARLFYSAAALVLLLVTLLGFQLFYLQGKAYPGRELPPPIRTIIIAHGIGMTLWMLLFFVQTSLIATGKRRLHMTLGKIGAVLAAINVYFGVRIALGSGRFTPEEVLLWNLAPKQFMAVSLFTITTFGILVAIAIWKRKHPDIHRPMMLLAILAILAVLPPSLDRIDVIKLLYSETIFGTLFGPYFSMLVIGLILLTLNFLLTRSLDRCLAIGYIGLILLSAFTMKLATTNAWENIATFLVG